MWTPYFTYDLTYVANVNNIIKGVLWNGLGLIVEKGFSLFVQLLLAKLLVPEDFGLVAMSMVFIRFVQVVGELGVSSALIQRAEAELRIIHFDTVFWFGIGFSTLLFLALAFVVGPFAAWFYEVDELRNILPTIGIGILLRPITVVHRAILTREMKFKRLTIISNTANVVSGGLAVLMALWGFGVWSLVQFSIMPALIMIPQYFTATRYIPQLRFSQSAFKDVFDFGVYTTGTNIVNTVINQFDYLLIGKMLGPVMVGIYGFSFLLTNTVRSNMMQVVNSVMFPAYSRVKDDLPKLRSYYLRVVEYNAIIVFPVMMVLLVAGEGIVQFIWGDKWIGAITPMYILTASVVLHMLVNSSTMLLRSMGKPKLELYIQLFKLVVVFFPFLYILTRDYGIVGSACAVLINKLVAVPISAYYLNKIVHISIGQMVSSLKGVVGALIFGVIGGRLAGFFLPDSWFLVSGLISLIIYGTFLYNVRYNQLSKLIITIKPKSN